MKEDNENTISIKLTNNCLEGFLFLPVFDWKVKVTLNFEEETPSLEKMKFFFIKSENRLTQLNKFLMQKLFSDISRELTDSSYSQSDYLPQKEDYTKLEKDLMIIQINFFEEDMVMILDSKEIYPNMKIYCQLDDDLEIIDLNIV